MTKDCNYCGLTRPRRDTHCPHCGRPSDFPNVEDASDPEETKALTGRYGKAMNDAASRVCSKELAEFESRVAADSQAVFACPGTRLMGVIMGEVDLYATYHNLAVLRIPKKPPLTGPNWDQIRPVAETALFGDEFKKRIHYAALTLDGRGLPSYGDYEVQLRESMIAHRTTVFEENSLLFMSHHDIKIFDSSIPKGYRATWANRGRLAATKLVGRLGPGATQAKFAAILMHSATNRSDDDFIEVHVFGPLTLFSIKKINYSAAHGGLKGKRKRSRPARGTTSLKILADKLSAAGVEFERS